MSKAWLVTEPLSHGKFLNVTQIAKVASDSDSLFKEYMVGSKVFFLLIML